MPAFTRSDVQSISISPAHGGCGQEHARNGARVFKLDCPQCTAVVLGQNRPRVLRWSKERGTHVRTADNWAEWTSSIADIPLTYDEQLERERTKSTGQTEMERLQAMAIAAQLGIPVPQALATSLGGVRALEELRSDPQVICAGGHANRPGARFCDLCGVSMQAPAEPVPAGQAVNAA